MNKTVTFLILLVCLAKTEVSQAQHYYIKGTLNDTGTKQKIEFASIGITNTTIGTAADENGEFFLLVENEFRKERLKISCIGYLTKTFSIDSILLLGENNLIIYLKPDIALLDEVIVKSAPIDPTDIIKAAVNSVGKNYPQQPFNLELFSTILVSDSLAHENYKVETILLGYYSGYNPAGKRKFQITQKRTTGKNPVKTDFGYWPSYEISAADLLTDPNGRGIFDLNQLDGFKFQYKGVSIYEDDTVYNIEYYAPKPTTKITGYGIVPKTYKGNIYITTSTQAVVRHEIITNSFRYHVIYKKLNGMYFPYYFSGQRTQQLKLSAGGRGDLKSNNTIVVNKIILQRVKLIDAKANEWDVEKVKYDENFWSTFYPGE